MTTLPGFEHKFIGVGDGVRLHAVCGGSGKPLFLLHGFPQTWHEWRHVMPALAQNHFVVAVDLKGAGRSDKPVGGYDKVTMAGELDRLRAAMGFDKVQVIGHDIGGMVALAWAASCRESLERLVILDVPIPGSSIWDKVFSDPRVWHFAFFMKLDLPEMLVAGREREFVDHFLHDRIKNFGAFTDADIDIFGRAFALPGAARGGFNWYRAFAKDAEDNRAFAKDRIEIPVLALGGDQRWGSDMVPMLQEFASNVQGGAIKDCNHWVPEEQPDALMEQLRHFLARG